MRALYRRLGAAGLPKTFVRNAILPSWWDDEAALEPAGYAHALVLLRRHTGLDLTALSDGRESLQFSPSIPCRLKTPKRKSNKGTAPAVRQHPETAPLRGLATQIAEIAGLGAPGKGSPKVPSALEIRDEILTQGKPWVDLESLLEFSWRQGIPVLHVSQLPATMKRLQGLAAFVGGRFVIVIADQHRFSSWQLFVLAHELGHIALGHHHTDRDEVVVDEVLDKNSADGEETAANEYALQLIAAGEKFQSAGGRWVNASELASEAKRLATDLHIDPGHIALNYGHNMGRFFPVALAALNQLEPGANAPALFREKLAAHLDWSKLPVDASEFLMRLCGPAQTPST